MESMARWRREDATILESKEFLNDLVSNLIKSNGMNTDEFRLWTIRLKSNAILLDNNRAILQLILRTTLGPLKDEIDRFILEFLQGHPEKNRHDVPWLDLYEHVKKEFLPVNDMQQIRDDLENFRQKTGEGIRDYNRKFRALAEMGYPTEMRTNDQVRTLIKYYIKGLAKGETAKNVLKASPASLVEAMAAAQDNAELDDALRRLGHRQEEPMDISAIRPKPTVDPLDKINKQLERITSKMAAMEIQIQQQQRYPQRKPRKSSNKHSWTADGKPICFSCHNSGHISRNCPVSNQQSKPMDVSSVPQVRLQDQGNF